jgi:hypothetical protein
LRKNGGVVARSQLSGYERGLEGHERHRVLLAKALESTE